MTVDVAGVEETSHSDNTETHPRVRTGHDGGRVAEERASVNAHARRARQGVKKLQIQALGRWGSVVRKAEAPGDRELLVEFQQQISAPDRARDHWRADLVLARGYFSVFRFRGLGHFAHWHAARSVLLPGFE